jgi:hypothetical protein
MTPVVNVRSKPKGLPMANTFCPTTSRSESPSGITVSGPAGFSFKRMTARSVSGSPPTTSAA